MIYKVTAQNGITVLVEANNQLQATQRAQSPQIVREFAQIVQESLSSIKNVEPLRRPPRQIKSLVFTDEFFNN